MSLNSNVRVSFSSSTRFWRRFNTSLTFMVHSSVICYAFMNKISLEQRESEYLISPLEPAQLPNQLVPHLNLQVQSFPQGHQVLLDRRQPVHGHFGVFFNFPSVLRKLTSFRADTQMLVHVLALNVRQAVERAPFKHLPAGQQMILQTEDGSVVKSLDLRC